MVSILFTSVPNQVSEVETERLISLLTPKLRQRIDLYKSAHRRLAHIYGRLLLQEVSRREGLEPGLENLAYTSTGKPIIPGGPGISISHSGSLAACALSDEGDVGLDIEAHRDIVIDNFRPWFSSEELETIMSCNSSSRELIRLWTLKEAVFKAGGVEAESILPASGTETGPVRAGGRDWHLSTLKLVSGFEAALACPEAAVGINLEYIPDGYL